MTAGTRLPGTPDPMFRVRGAHGVTLAGDRWGPESGPLVVLLHGGGQTRHAWKNTGRHLGEQGYHTIAYDARGHGDSDWAPDGEYLQGRMVDDLVAIIEEAGRGRRPVLVGASLGGGVSLSAVGEGRIAATALVMVDIAPRIEPEGVAKIRDFMFSAPDGFASLDEVADAIAAYQPHRSRPSDLSGLAKNVRLGSDGRYRWHWDPAFMERGRDLTARQRQHEHNARNVTVPILLVRGALSDIVSEEGARQFLELCPHAEYVNVTDASHMVAGDRNDIFAESVIEFLNRVVPIDGAERPGDQHDRSRNALGRRASRGLDGDLHDVP
jgi:pimeloyl-ACP methyl ester carboxylesterase